MSESDIKIACTRAPSGAFTFAEVLIAMFVFALVVAGTMAVFLSTLRSANATSQAVDINARSRFLQEKLLIDLRGVESITELTQSGTATVDGATQNVFREFTANIFEYGSSAAAASVKVTYKFYKNEILRIDPKYPSGVAVMTDLSDAWFEFYNRKGTAVQNKTTSADQVYAVRITCIPQKTSKLINDSTLVTSSALVQLRQPTLVPK